MLQNMHNFSFGSTAPDQIYDETGFFSCFVCCVFISEEDTAHRAPEISLLPFSASRVKISYSCFLSGFCSVSSHPF
jgi:hypothetical protein